MVDQLTLQTIGILLTAVTVSIAAIYYTLTLRYTRRNQELQLETRQAQLFMQIYNRFQEVEFRKNFNDVLTREWEDYDDYVRKYGRFTNPTAQAASTSIGLFFEGLGVLLERGLLDVDMVSDLMSSPVRLYWEKMSPIFMGMRARMNRDDTMAWAEYLYNEVLKRDMKLGWEKEVIEPYQEP
jgi:hypothetical protein